MPIYRNLSDALLESIGRSNGSNDDYLRSVFGRLGERAMAHNMGSVTEAAIRGGLGDGQSPIPGMQQAYPGSIYTRRI